MNRSFDETDLRASLLPHASARDLLPHASAREIPGIGIPADRAGVYTLYSSGSKRQISNLSTTERPLSSSPPPEQPGSAGPRGGAPAQPRGVTFSPEALTNRASINGGAVGASTSETTNANTNTNSYLDSEAVTRSASGPSIAQRKLQRRIDLAFSFSWVVNWLLLFIKAYAFYVSRSQSVLAALADSVVDLISQMVISTTEFLMRRHNPEYPVGRSRLEAIGVMICACIMTVASVEVVQSASADLIRGLKGHLPQLEVGKTVYIVIGAGIAMKFVLWLYCRRLQDKSDSVNALAEDHLNDIASNFGAIFGAVIAFEVKKLWWVDSTFAILISLWIILRWVSIVKEQVDKLVGRAAPDSLVDDVLGIANTHHSSLEVDVIRAYHFGARFNVEIEVVLPIDMTLKDTHDISLSLQHKIEDLELVERCFVHVDYEKRDTPEHKVERALLLAVAQEPTANSHSPRPVQIQIQSPRY